MSILNIDELLIVLNRAGLHLSVDTNGKMIVTGPADALTPALKAHLRQHSAALKDHLAILASAPIVGPGPVVLARETAVVVLSELLLVFSPPKQLADDLAALPGCTYDRLLECWCIPTRAGTLLADAIMHHLGIQTGPAIAALQGAE